MAIVSKNGADLVFVKLLQGVANQFGDQLSSSDAFYLRRECRRVRQFQGQVRDVELVLQTMSRACKPLAKPGAGEAEPSQ
jgi:hypothetical protein